MKYEDEFKILLSDLRRRQEKANAEYADCPTGTINRETRQGKQILFHVYEEKGKRRRVVINDQTNMLTALARKRYLEEELTILDRDIAALQRFMSIDIEATPNAIISRLQEKYRALPIDCFFTQSQPMDSLQGYLKRWAEEPYEQSTYKPEDKVHLTSRGLKVRTKSEVVIAEMLDAAGINYRYEQIIYIEEFSFAPDFTVITDKGLVYWEHAGMIHDEEYRNHHKWKLSMYERMGIVPWKNLIVTYDNENGGLDSRIIRSEIENKLL